MKVSWNDQTRRWVTICSEDEMTSLVISTEEGCTILVDEGRAQCQDFIRQVVDIATEKGL